ncbi:hypothetical protein RA27_20635 [Ruegeria sp. ANG-R]|uniref:hypothetical protein n=1 Tax=Ruegeria sp. ANG-R TaxID=1577903 RepID=UPI0005807994|nr:hypothetical protein [Ruegeria sp. ANG-R]KIC38170.1 hypothetical protein RA27_20635 [Ruegeria sp. ANG-R]
MFGQRKFVDLDAVLQNYVEFALHLGLEKEMAKELQKISPEGYDFSRLRTFAMEHARDTILALTEGNENAPEITEFIFDRIQQIFDDMEDHVTKCVASAD